ncbi:MAG TPA: hypothetical protein PLK76_00410 [bacterium]|nr:hypothetical protein [bacterium]
MKWEVYSKRFIESFVLSRNKFSSKFKELRQHLEYCSRCRSIYEAVAQKHKIEIGVDEAIRQSPPFK